MRIWAREDFIIVPDLYSGAAVGILELGLPTRSQRSTVVVLSLRAVLPHEEVTPEILGCSVL